MLGLRNSFWVIVVIMAIALSILVYNNILSVGISILIVFISTIIIHILDGIFPQKSRKSLINFVTYIMSTYAPPSATNGILKVQAKHGH